MIGYLESKQNTNLNLKLIHSLHFLAFHSWMEQNKRTQHGAAAAATAGEQMHEHSQAAHLLNQSPGNALVTNGPPSTYSPEQRNQMSSRGTRGCEKLNLVKSTKGLYKYQNQSFRTN